MGTVKAPTTPAATPRPRIRMRCPHCGSEAICKDAWAAWDETNQRWELGGVYDSETCIGCERDGDEMFERTDIATGLKVGSAIDQGMPVNCASGQGHTMQPHPVTGAPYCTACCPLQDDRVPTKIASTGD
ncbi:hypothetical protein [Ponticaulis sp.]|uniref:hypothetical protein n=1 Tax=Ponticaulis sp. TaxID=2020902 RepID=UPI000C453832|nr:hypothetical protein [Ponticaulis sp.]MBN06090.1 hypothetical protein [Ponticaulis sp.]